MVEKILPNTLSIKELQQVSKWCPSLNIQPSSCQRCSLVGNCRTKSLQGDGMVCSIQNGKKRGGRKPMAQGWKVQGQKGHETRVVGARKQGWMDELDWK